VSRHKYAALKTHRHCCIEHTLTFIHKITFLNFHTVMHECPAQAHVGYAHNLSLKKNGLVHIKSVQSFTWKTNMSNNVQYILSREVDLKLFTPTVQNIRRPPTYRIDIFCCNYDCHMHAILFVLSFCFHGLSVCFHQSYEFLCLSFPPVISCYGHSIVNCNLPWSFDI